MRALSAEADSAGLDEGEVRRAFLVGVTLLLCHMCLNCRSSWLWGPLPLQPKALVKSLKNLQMMRALVANPQLGSVSITTTPWYGVAYACAVLSFYLYMLF